MKKILLSIATIAFVSALVIGGTTAIFSDTEVSTGNTFTAGAIDLTVDNDSYYNGVFNEGTSWLQKDLEKDDLFFDFRDLKPGDYGEDTISLHVKNNDSYLCADVTLTSNTDNGSTEPELNDEDPYTAGEGELADNVHFIWWADDGDNVLETNEHPLPSGTLGELNVDQTATVSLADANTNLWNPNNEGGALPGDSTRYIGKAWCFGKMTLTPVEPGDNNDPTVNPGFTCDGSQEDNSTQTDDLTADIGFRAVQSRNNEDFRCIPPAGPETATLTIDKEIVFSDPTLPPVDISAFTLTITGPGGSQTVSDEVPTTGLTPGLYLVTETGPPGFNPEFGLACSDEGDHGEVTLAAGDNLTCRITNRDERS
ncbi:MAG: TasA family protein [Candidatus Vogelbacteria bacterium]